MSPPEPASLFQAPGLVAQENLGASSFDRPVHFRHIEHRPSSRSPPAVLDQMLTALSLHAQMAQVMDSPHRSLLGDGHGKDDPMAPRTVPILTPTIQMSAPDSEPMDITTPTNSSAPASTTKSPDRERDRDTNGTPSRSEGQGASSSMTMPAPTAAAAAVHGPKIVQTAFIHKLYKCAPLPPGSLLVPNHVNTDLFAVCSRTATYPISYLGQTPKRVLSCRRLLNSPRCSRMCAFDA